MFALSDTLLKSKNYCNTDLGLSKFLHDLELRKSKKGKIKMEEARTSNVLRFVMVPLITQERCVKPISIFPPEDITANMVCAANENGGRGTCVYDEGGPLIIPR